MQPNLSNVVVVMVIFMAMLWINGLDLKQVLWLAVGAIALGAIEGAEEAKAHPCIKSHQTSVPQ